MKPYYIGHSPAACLLDLSNNFAEKKINLSERKARLSYTHIQELLCCLFYPSDTQRRGSDGTLSVVTFHQIKL